MTENAHVIYRGSVQGVGFRFTVRRLATQFQVAGFVRNLPDGTVELEAEGEEDEIKQFLGAVQARMGQHVRDCKVQWTEFTGRFTDFSIRF